MTFFFFSPAIIAMMFVLVLGLVTVTFNEILSVGLPLLLGYPLENDSTMAVLVAC